jgi:hypothetical protein
VTVQSRSGDKLQVQLTGSAVEQTRWAAAQPIYDLSIGKPNLEFLFRQYYNHDSVRPVQESATNGFTEEVTKPEGDGLISETEEP